MKQATALLALALLATPAQAADNASVARSVTSIIIYHVHCETVPEVALKAADKAIGKIPMHVAKTAGNEAIAIYESEDPGSFCTRMKPFIENLIRTGNIRSLSSTQPSVKEPMQGQSDDELEDYDDGIGRIK